MAEEKVNIFTDLRRRALDIKASDLGAASEATEVYGALMDLNIHGAHASIVGFSNGEASVYLSTGGGFIGGGRHANVAVAAKDFVHAASQLRSYMEPTNGYPLPSAGMTAFYAMSSQGVLFAEERESAFNSGASPLTPLFAAGQGVITAYRTLPRVQA